MNRKLVLTFLAVLSFASGCVINGGSHKQPGDVTFNWRFYGQTCAQASNVNSVQVTIPGEALANNGVYACSSNAYDGIVLHNFNPGSYSFTVDGYDFSGARVYTATGTFVVDGNILVTVDLTPVGQPSGWAYLTWAFPSDPNATRPCVDRGITTVDVQIDNMAPVTYTCENGLADPGVQTPLVSAGAHNITLWARTSNSFVIYSLASTFTAVSNNPGLFHYNLQWAVGGGALKWAMTNGTTNYSCQTAGVNTMYVNFQNVADNTTLYGPLNDTSQWDRIDNFCSQYTFLHWDYLPPGTYRVFMIATGTGGTYRSNTNSPPQITVTVAQWPTEAQAQVVSMAYSP